MCCAFKLNYIECGAHIVGVKAKCFNNLDFCRIYCLYELLLSVSLCCVTVVVGGCFLDEQKLRLRAEEVLKLKAAH